MYQKKYVATCCLWKCNDSIREQLKNLGYQYFTIREDADCILIDPYETDGMWYEYKKDALKDIVKELKYGGQSIIDCGTDERSFIALASIRTDTDINQWFASNYKHRYMDSFASYHFCTKDDYRDYFGDNPQDENYDDFHKMTPNEVVEFMNNNYIAPKQESFIWVAREPDIEDRYSDSQLLGKLTAFYDTPIYCFNGDTGRQEWCRARKIGDLPSYMFPDISFKNSPVKFKQISE